MTFEAEVEGRLSLVLWNEPTLPEKVDLSPFEASDLLKRMRAHQMDMLANYQRLAAAGFDRAFECNLVARNINALDMAIGLLEGK